MNQPIRVLVAEDEPLVCNLLESMLTDSGYQVVAKVHNGLDAVRLTRERSPDVVLMDVDMPELNGIDACHRLQREKPVPVVMLTSFEDPATITAASTAGVGAYLVKPPKPGEIERSITVAMARFHDMQELRRLNAELHQQNHDMEVLIVELRDTLNHVKTLRRLLPICASCKKIRDDQGYWHMVEDYLSSHSELVFSHGLCPDCMRRLYPELQDPESTEEEKKL
jgi:AmiR/NasT family two-component response regulator